MRHSRIIAWQTHKGLPVPPDDFPPPDVQTHPRLDAKERELVMLFLKRYVTWCALARHFDRVPGAVHLYHRVRFGYS